VGAIVDLFIKQNAKVEQIEARLYGGDFSWGAANSSIIGETVIKELALHKIKCKQPDKY
jgi:hypothetical protein